MAPRSIRYVDVWFVSSVQLKLASGVEPANAGQLVSSNISISFEIHGKETVRFGSSL